MKLHAVVGVGTVLPLGIDGGHGGGEVAGGGINHQNLVGIGSGRIVVDPEILLVPARGNNLHVNVRVGRFQGVAVNIKVSGCCISCRWA